MRLRASIGQALQALGLLAVVGVMAGAFSPSFIRIVTQNGMYGGGVVYPGGTLTLGMQPGGVTLGGASSVGTTFDPTRSSSTPAVIPEMTVTITTSGGPVWCSLSTSIRSALADVGFVSLYALSLLGLIGTIDTALTIPAISYVAAGTHTFDGRWFATSGSIRATGTWRRLDCRELA